MGHPRLPGSLAGPQKAPDQVEGAEAVRVATRTLRRIWTHPENRARRLRRSGAWVRWQLYERIVRRPVDARFYGPVRVRCHPHDPVASGVLYCGLPDPEEMRFLLAYLQAGDTFVDVGANIGLYSLLATSVPGVRSAAFEPSRLARDRLVENVELNDLSSAIDVEPTAIGESEGTVQLTRDLYAMNRVLTSGLSAVVGEYATVDVPMTTLDAWFTRWPDRRPSLVKVDVEGHEPEVLRGARRLLTEERPVLILEVNDVDALTHELRVVGYVPFTFRPADCTVAEISLADRLHRNVLATPSLDTVRRRLRG
jgi:FkbM family methyltransferase